MKRPVHGTPVGDLEQARVSLRIQPDSDIDDVIDAIDPALFRFAVRTVSRAAREFTNRRHPPGCMVITAATNCSESAAHVQAALAARRRSGEANLRTRIQRGVEEGELPPRTDCMALAKFYSTVLEGMSIQARDGASRKSLLLTADAAMRAWPEKSS